MNKIRRFANYLGRILLISIITALIFLIIGLGVYFMASGNAKYIIETVPYATLIASFVFVGITTYLDYRGIEIKKSISIGGTFGFISFCVVIALVEGVLFFLEKEITQSITNRILIVFSFCIISSSILLWIAKSKFYGGE